MLRKLWLVCIFMLCSTLAFGNISLNKSHPLANGTLSITMDSEPAAGLPAPKVTVLGHFIVFHNTVDWNTNWNLVVPSGNYRIIPHPVTDGTNVYVANTAIVFVPSGGLVNHLITYHLLV